MENSKHQILNSKQIQSTNDQNSKHYDLEDRTFIFAKRVIEFTCKPPRTIANVEIIKQLIRASSSVGANYIEANESFSKKDFVFRVKVCRKEAKESRYWLKLVEVRSNDVDRERLELVQEAAELLKIFGSILKKCKN